MNSPGMPVQVRPASEDDVDAVLALHSVVQGLMAKLSPDRVKTVVDPVSGKAFFASRFRDPQSRVAMAFSDGLPVGYVWFVIRAWPETPLMQKRSYVLVNDLSVAAAFQRQGVGRALLRYVEEDAARMNIHEVDVSHWVVNSEAEKFYEALGFSTFMAVLNKRLSVKPTKNWQPPSTVRAIAIGLVRRGEQLLLMMVRDDNGTVRGWRPLGGGIEFGEQAEDALKREFVEELGQQIEKPRLMCVLENLFEHQGAKGHEIVFVFDTRFSDDAAYDTELNFIDGGALGEIQWIDVEEFRTMRQRIFPSGLQERL